MCREISKDIFHVNILDANFSPLRDSLPVNHDFDQVKNLIFSLHLFEFGFVGDFTLFINDSLNYLVESNYFPNLENVYILYNTSSVDLSEINSKFNVTKIYLNYFLMRSYFTDKYCKNFKLNKWKPDNKQALFLVGDPLRVNRLPIIQAFAVHKNLELLNHSLNFNYLNRYKNIEDYVRQNMYHISYFSKLMFRGNVNKFVDFLLKNERVFDTDSWSTMDLPIFNKSAYIIPDEWFSASLILCMESYFYDVSSSLGMMDNDRNILSEKFWKTVQSKKPFIFCSHNDHLYQKIENLGFKTFLNYTSRPKKLRTGPLNISTLDEKTLVIYTQTVYKRTTSFLDNMVTNQSDIEADVEYNYDHWNRLVTYEWDKLLSNCPPLKEINKETVNYLFLMGDEDDMSED